MYQTRSAPRQAAATWCMKCVNQGRRKGCGTFSFAFFCYGGECVLRAPTFTQMCGTWLEVLYIELDVYWRVFFCGTPFYAAEKTDIRVLLKKNASAVAATFREIPDGICTIGRLGKT